MGFLLSLWSGSRALNVYIDTVTIMYGLGGHRGIIRTRMLSFTLTVQRYFPVPAGSAAALFRPFAARYPVFELMPKR